MTMRRFRALRAHWLKHPPVHKMVAAFVGYKAPHSAGGASARSEADASAIANEINAALGGRR